MARAQLVPGWSWQLSSGEGTRREHGHQHRTATPPAHPPTRSPAEGMRCAQVALDDGAPVGKWPICAHSRFWDIGLPSPQRAPRLYFSATPILPPS